MKIINRLLSTMILLLSCINYGNAEDLTIPYSFVNGTAIDANQVNENFTAIKTGHDNQEDILNGTSPFTNNITIQKASGKLVLNSTLGSNGSVEFKENSTNKALIEWNSSGNKLLMQEITQNAKFELFNTGSIILTSTNTQDITLTPSDDIVVSSGDVNLISGNLQTNGTNRITSSGIGTFAANTTISDFILTSGSIINSTGSISFDNENLTTTGILNAGSIKDTDFTGSKAMMTDGSGNMAESSVTSTELGYISGVTSTIQTQLNSRVLDTGDTMTGNLIIQKASPQLALDANTTTTASIVFKDNTTQKAVLNYNLSSAQSVWDNSTASNSVILKDSGEISLDSQSSQDITLIPSDDVVISTGDLTLTSGNLQINGTSVINSSRNIINSPNAVIQTDWVTCSYSTLAGSGECTLIAAGGSGVRYDIISIDARVQQGFTGGGGDRNISITDNTSTWTVMPAASVQTIHTRDKWSNSSTLLPMPATASHFTTASADNTAVIAKYSGGTTDYSTAGNVNIRIIYAYE